MSSVLMTSTMKSDPAGALVTGSVGGVPVSAAATWAFGGSADGRRGGTSTGVCGVAAGAVAGATVVAPATATPAKNLRRLNFASLSLRIVAPFRWSRRHSTPLRCVAGTIARVYRGARRANAAWANGTARMASSQWRLGKTKTGPQGPASHLLGAARGSNQF